MLQSQSEYHHKYYLANREKIKERSRQWAKDNPIRFREIRRKSMRKWYLANRDYFPKWRSKNRERCLASGRKWSRNNPAKCYSKVAMRRARKRRAIVPGTESDIGKIYARCKTLRQWFDVCVDHIIPLSHGGMHHPSNLQIIYISENNKKGVNWLGYQPSVVFK